MKKIIIYTLLFLATIPLVALSQSPKKRIGKSVVIKNEKIIGDSIVSEISLLDKKGRIMDWFMMPIDSMGVIKDTVFYKYDSLEQCNYYKTKFNTTFFSYDEHGTQIRSIYCTKKDTFTTNFKAKYKDGKIITLSDGMGVDSTFYRGNTKVTKSYSSFIFLLYVTTEIKKKNSTSTIVKWYDDNNGKGDEQRFIEYRNGKIKTSSRSEWYEKGILFKVGESAFKNGKIISSTETHLKPDYKIITVYHYE